VTDIRFRPFQKADLAPALDVWERAWLAGLDAADHGILDRGAFERRMLINELPDHPVIVAEGTDGLAGFVILHTEDAFISHLVVAPDQARRGIGRDLVALSLAILGTPARLTVLDVNPSAALFWQKLGARPLGAAKSRGGLPATAYEIGYSGALSGGTT
jgi:ribosomal protein S18 acetylase RimI-like enzyme